MDGWSMLSIVGLLLVMYLLWNYVGAPVSNKCSKFLQQDSLYTLGPFKGGNKVKSYYYLNNPNDKAKEKTEELQNLSTNTRQLYTIDTGKTIPTASSGRRPSSAPHPGPPVETAGEPARARRPAGTTRACATRFLTMCVQHVEFEITVGFSVWGAFGPVNNSAKFVP